MEPCFGGSIFWILSGVWDTSVQDILNVFAAQVDMQIFKSHATLGNHLRLDAWSQFCQARNLRCLNHKPRLCKVCQCPIASSDILQSSSRQIAGALGIGHHPQQQAQNMSRFPFVLTLPASAEVHALNPKP